MRLITLTKIKNEADIVESFVRYHGEIADEMFFIENGSTDGTLEILQALREEGYPITIFDEREQVFDELKFINKYAKIILKQNMADWLIPIDADEFLYAGGKNPREELKHWKPDVVYMVDWRTYLCDKTGRERTGFVPERFEIYREERYEKLMKVILPGKLYLEKGLLIERGNHKVEGIDIKTEKKENIKFAHYPIRSEEQFKTQISINRLMQMSRWNRLKYEAWHWDEMYELIKQQQIDLEKISLFYSIPEEEHKNAGEIGTCQGKLEHGFMDDICLKYESYARKSAFYNLMCASETLAKRLAVPHNSVQEEDHIPKKRVVLYGMGRLVPTYIHAINYEIYEIIAYLDSNVSRRNEVFNGKPIQGVEVLERETYDYVVIMSRDYFHEIKCKLLQLGVLEGKIYFITEFLKIGWGEMYHCI